MYQFYGDYRVLSSIIKRHKFFSNCCVLWTINCVVHSGKRQSLPSREAGNIYIVHIYICNHYEQCMVHGSAYTYIHIYICICMNICIYVYMYIYVSYIWKERHILKIQNDVIFHTSNYYPFHTQTTLVHQVRILEQKQWFLCIGRWQSWKHILMAQSTNIYSVVRDICHN